MLAVRCPGCGAPQGVSLETPDALRCGACGYQGALPPGVEDDLRAAARVLFEMDASRRQLSESQRRSLASGAWATPVQLGLTVLTLVPFVLCLVVCAGSFDVTSDASWALFFAPMLLTAAAGGLLGLALIRRSRLRLAAACVAIPPAAEGESARCHVCGGPLTVSPGVAFARCAFCSADNLVSSPILARLSRETSVITERFAEEVRSHTADMARASRRARTLVWVGAAMAPVAGFVVALAIGFVLQQTEVEPHDDMLYTLVEHGAPPRTCVAVVYRERGWKTWVHVAEETGGESVPHSLRGHASARTFPWTRLTELTIAHDDMPGARVERVYGNYGIAENWVVLLGERGTTEHLHPEQLCLVEDATPIVEPLRESDLFY